MTRLLLAALFLAILLLSALPAHAEGQWWWCGDVPCSADPSGRIYLPQVAK